MKVRSDDWMTSGPAGQGQRQTYLNHLFRSFISQQKVTFTFFQCNDKEDKQYFLR